MSSTAPEISLQETKKTQETLLITSYINPDGIGDWGHFLEVANPEMLALIPACENVNIIRLIVCDSEFRDEIQEKTKKFKVEDTYVVYFDKKTVSEVAFQEYYLKNKLFRDTLAKVTAVVNVSTKRMIEVLLPAIGLKLGQKIPVVNIGEHGASMYVIDEYQRSIDPEAVDNSQTNNREFRHAGFGLNHHGLFIKKPKALSKEEALLNISDQNFKVILFAKDKQLVPTGKSAEKTATANFTLNKESVAQFLKENLIVPCYFQFGADSFAAFVQGVVASEIISASSYKTIIFYLNRDQFNEQYFDKAFLAKHNVRSIKIDRIRVLVKDKHFNIYKTVNINNSLKEDTGITIRIIEGLKLSHEDYHFLIQSAQLFYGCSGDKGFERAISYGLIPLFQPKPYKMSFLRDFIQAIQWVPAHYDVNLLECFVSMIHDENNDFNVVESSMRLAKALNHDLMKSWPDIVEYLYKNLNYYNALSKVITQIIKLAEYNRIPMEERGMERAVNLLSQIKELDSFFEKNQSDRRQILLDSLAMERPETKASKESQESIKGKEPKKTVDTVTTTKVQFIGEKSAEEPRKEAFFNLNGKYCLGKDLNSVLEKLKTNTQIKALSLSDKGIFFKSSWDSLLEMLRVNRTIQRLDLGWNKIDDDMLESLLRAVRENGTVMELSLGANHIKKVDSIISFFKNGGKLKLLDLTCNSIDDTGAKLFAEVINHWSLKALVLDGNRITRDGAKILDSVLDLELHEMDSLTIFRQDLVQDPLISEESILRFLPILNPEIAERVKNKLGLSTGFNSLALEKEQDNKSTPVVAFSNRGAGIVNISASNPKPALTTPTSAVIPPAIAAAGMTGLKTAKTKADKNKNKKQKAKAKRQILKI